MILNDVSYEKFSIYCIYGVLLKILLYFRNFSEANTCSNPILLVINSKKNASLNHIFIHTIDLLFMSVYPIFGSNPTVEMLAFSKLANMEM